MFTPWMEGCWLYGRRSGGGCGPPPQERASVLLVPLKFLGTGAHRVEVAYHWRDTELHTGEEVKVGHGAEAVAFTVK